MKINKLAIRIFAGILLFTSCSKEEEFVAPIQSTPSGKYQGGVIVVNEGKFGDGNASVSYISNDLQTVENDVFSTLNIGKKLGDVAQSIAFNGDLAYIIVNNSNKIEVVNRYTFESVATISTGLKNPRYMTFINDKGYVTNWGDGADATDDYIAVVDGKTNTLLTPISVIEGPEKIVTKDNKLYVAHQGGWGSGNSVSVINVTDNSKVSVTVGDVPSDLEFLGDDLLVLCGGKGVYSGAESAGSLVKVNTLNNSVTNTLSFTQTTDHPNHLKVVGDKIFYTLSNQVYKMGVADTTFPTASLINTTTNGVGFIYGFNIIQDKIFIGDSKGYVNQGVVYMYSLNGAFVGEIKVGIAPNAFYENK